MVSVPATGSTVVDVSSGGRRTVTGVSIRGRTVTFTLDCPVTAGSAVGVSYRKLDDNPLRDVAGDEVGEFARRFVVKEGPRGASRGCRVRAIHG